jgi:hypothetical protein
MLGPAERLVKHSSAAGLGEGSMVSVATVSTFATNPSSEGSITDTGLSYSTLRFRMRNEK